MKSFKTFYSIKKCRSCSSKKLVEILDLGYQCFGGIFPLTKEEKVPTGPLQMIKCKNCQLIQLKHNFNVMGKIKLHILSILIYCMQKQIQVLP